MLLVLGFEKAAGSEFARRAREYVWVALPVYVLFGLLDRLYQFYRFGSFFKRRPAWRRRSGDSGPPGLPASFPFSTPLHTGLMGALFTPEKSIFLFDPLLILMVVLAAVAWRRFSAAVKA